MPIARRFACRSLAAAATAAAAVLLLGGCAECEKDFDCPRTRLCNLSEGTCEAFVCKTDRDCPPSQGCKSNRCRAQSAPGPVQSPDAFLLGPATVGSSPLPPSGPSGPPGPADLGVFNPPD